MIRASLRHHSHLVLDGKTLVVIAEDASVEILQKQFEFIILRFGFEPTDMIAIRAAGAALSYLQETQRADLDVSISPLIREAVLQIDAATRRSLEVSRTLPSVSEGSLLGVMDRTNTSMGSRLLADWIAAQLIDRTAIALEGCS